jgi:hypothetical protein
MADPVEIPAVDVAHLHRRVRELTQSLDELIAQVSQTRYSGSGGWDQDKLEKGLAFLKSAVDMLHSATVELMSARRV